MHSIKSSFLVVLAFVGGQIWRPFGVHDGGPGRQKLLFFWSGQRPSDCLFSGGLWACFWEVFGPTFEYLKLFSVDDS